MGRLCSQDKIRPIKHREDKSQNVGTNLPKAARAVEVPPSSFVDHQISPISKPNPAHATWRYARTRSGSMVGLDLFFYGKRRRRIVVMILLLESIQVGAFLRVVRHKGMVRTAGRGVFTVGVAFFRVDGCGIQCQMVEVQRRGRQSFRLYGGTSLRFWTWATCCRRR